MTHIRKMQNTIEGKTLAIDKTVLLTKAIICKKEFNVSIKKV